MNYRYEFLNECFFKCQNVIIRISVDTNNFETSLGSPLIFSSSILRGSFFPIPYRMILIKISLNPFDTYLKYIVIFCVLFTSLSTHILKIRFRYNFTTVFVHSIALQFPDECRILWIDFRFAEYRQSIMDHVNLSVIRTTDEGRSLN